MEVRGNGLMQKKLQSEQHCISQHLEEKTQWANAFKVILRKIFTPGTRYLANLLIVTRDMQDLKKFISHTLSQGGS